MTLGVVTSVEARPMGSELLTDAPLSTSIASAVTVSGSVNLGGSAGTFTAGDIGRTVTSVAVPAGTTIVSIVSDSTAVMSAAATSTRVTAATLGPVVTLNVDMADHFDEDGGQLLLNGALLTYTSIDPDADTITLAAPLSVAGSADDFVSMVEAGKPAVEWIADVAVDDGDSIPAVIPTALIPYFPEGTYDDEVVAEIAVVNDEHQVASQPQRTPTFDGQLVWNPYVTRQMGNDTIPDGTPTIIDTYAIDQGNDSITLGPSSMTVVYPGFYSMLAQAAFSVNSTGRRYVRIKVNSVQVGSTAVTAETSSTFVSTAVAMVLAEGDVVEVEVEQNSGAGLPLYVGAGRSLFTMYRVSV